MPSLKLTANQSDLTMHSLLPDPSPQGIRENGRELFDCTSILETQPQNMSDI